MNFTEEQKAVLVPAAVGLAAFVVLDEIVFRGPLKSLTKKNYLGQPGSPAMQKAFKKSAIGGVLSSIAASFVWQQSSAETRAGIEKVALPTGAAAATFVAVNRISAPFWDASRDRRPFAAAAAALVAWKSAKDESTPVVGRLPERTFEPPFPPPFGPEFPPQYEG